MIISQMSITNPESTTIIIKALRQKIRFVRKRRKLGINNQNRIKLCLHLILRKALFRTGNFYRTNQSISVSSSIFANQNFKTYFKKSNQVGV